MRVRPSILILLLCVAAAASAQTLQPLPASVSAPHGDVLLRLTREWAAASPLGDLASRETGPGDVELRYWGGFGLSGTAGVVLRRENGTWKGWTASVVTCFARVPFAVADTMTDATIGRYATDARRKCQPAASGPGRVIQADRLELAPIEPERVPAAWRAAMEAGAPILPRAIERAWSDDAGYTHVVELRIGKTYRASVIACADPPEKPDDYRVQQVAGALARAIPDSRIDCTRQSRP